MQHLVARQKTSISHQNRLSILCDTRLLQRKLVHKKHLRASTILNIVSKLPEAGTIETGDALSGARVGPLEYALRILARLGRTASNSTQGTYPPPYRYQSNK